MRTHSVSAGRRIGVLLNDNSQHTVRLAVILLTALAYFITGKLGLKLAYLHASATAVWAPTGIALAAFLLAGHRVWPGVFAGAFLVNVTTAGSILSSLGISTGNTLEGLLAAKLARRFAHGSRAFEKSQDIVIFWALACMVAPIVSATLGVTSLCLTGYANWQFFVPIWLTWWLGDAVGGFLISSLILTWLRNPKIRYTSSQALEAVFLALTVMLTSFLVFGGIFPFTYICVPVVLWAAFRFGIRETATVMFVLAGMALWRTLSGTGPFVVESRNQSLILLQAYIGVTAVTTLAVAATVAERGRGARALKEAHDLLERRVVNRTRALSSANEALRAEVVERTKAEGRFRRLVESAPDAMVIANAQGTIVLVNSRAERMFEYSREELVGASVETLIPRPMGAGIELFGVRKGGEEFPVEISLSPIDTEEGPLVCSAIRDMTEQKRLEEELAAVERQRALDLRDFAVSVQRVQEEERRRIARELHDDLGQRLSGLKLSLQAIESDVPAAYRSHAGRLQQIQRELDRTIGELRRLSYNLRPATLDDFGLVVALEVLCKEFEKLHHVQAAFVSGGVPPKDLSDANVDIAIYRIAQEALSNVAKHAGATHVSVQLYRRNGVMAVTVEDDGHGFDMDSTRKNRRIGHGLGLVSMRERSELLGGVFLVKSSPRAGTTVHAEIPYVEGTG